MTAVRYVLNPYLIVTQKSGRVRVHNPYHRKEFEADAGVRPLLDFFTQPHTLRELQREIPTANDLLAMLLDNFILLAHDEVSFLSRGFLEEAPTPIGEARAWSEIERRACAGSFVLFGVPSEGGITGEPGAGEGPGWIRRALLTNGFDPDRGRTLLDYDLRRSWDTSGLAVHDAGNVHSTPAEAAAVVGARVGKLARRILGAGAIPVMLGGDHSFTWWALREILSLHRAVGVLHLDAHSDLYATQFDFGDELTHANPFAFARRSPALRVLRQVGLRGLEQSVAGTRPVADRRIQFVTAAEIRRRGVRAALEGLPGRIPYYLSFDVDVIDPAQAPETGAPRMGGLSVAEAVALIDEAGRRLNVVAADFMEVGAPVHPRRHLAADATARCAAALMLSRMPFKALRRHVYVAAHRR